MACFGIQFRNEAAAATAMQALSLLRGHFAAQDGPGHHDVARGVDTAGYETWVVLAYWREPEAFDRWIKTPSLVQWWEDPAREQEGVGYFREILRPRVTHLETLFSTPDRNEGLAILTQHDGIEVREHAYWGSVRDRLAAAQTDALRADGMLGVNVSPSGTRVRLLPHDHIALIRSGQDWEQTEGLEREIYLHEVRPVLHQAMEFLSTSGLDIGCYANRYLQQMGPDGTLVERTFGLSVWRSLEHLEAWAESHPSHVLIFSTFLKMLQTLNWQLKLRLYHEVMVAGRDEQHFEYVNCHRHTGLLGAAQHAELTS